MQVILQQLSAKTNRLRAAYVVKLQTKIILLNKLKLSRVCVGLISNMFPSILEILCCYLKSKHYSWYEIKFLISLCLIIHEISLLGKVSWSYYWNIAYDWILMNFYSVLDIHTRFIGMPVGFQVAFWYPSGTYALFSLMKNKILWVIII